MHRFAVGDYLLHTDNKGKNVADYFKEKDVTDQRETCLNCLHSIFGGLAPTLGS